MKRKVIKVFGYIMLAIGIIGGLSTIDMVFNGNLLIWIILVVCFCSIGSISLSASKGMRNVESEEKNPKSTEKAICHTPRKTYDFILHYGKRAYSLIKEQVVKVDHLYFKVVLTIIAVLLLIIAVELNDKLSEIAFEIYRK